MKDQQETNAHLITKVLNRIDTFMINGIKYNGVDDLLPGSDQKITSLKDYHFDIYKDRLENIILRRCERFPCFDEFDRIHENRYYRRYIICSSFEDAKNKYDFIMTHNIRFDLSSRAISYLAPIIYADDGSQNIEIVYKEQC